MLFQLVTMNIYTRHKIPILYLLSSPPLCSESFTTRVMHFSSKQVENREDFIWKIIWKIYIWEDFFSDGKTDLHWISKLVLKFGELVRPTPTSWWHTTSPDQHSSLWGCLLEPSKWPLLFLSFHIHKYLLVIFCLSSTLGSFKDNERYCH